MSVHIVLKNKILKSGSEFGCTFHNRNQTSSYYKETEVQKGTGMDCGRWRALATGIIRTSTYSIQHFAAHHNACTDVMLHDVIDNQLYSQASLNKKKKKTGM